ncbi:hypothetical protein BSG1_18520 [Bacillus sp. SG-1]|nr:hypothetical protein BSG1_18520 [Bacillus sp. SG-1]
MDLEAEVERKNQLESVLREVAKDQKGEKISEKVS